MGRAIARLILVPLGFGLALIVGALVITTWGFEQVTHLVHGQEFSPETVDLVFNLIDQGTLLAAGMTLLPALAVIIIGEVAGIRSLVYYVAGGGAALAVIPFLSRLGQSPEGLPVSLWQVFAVAGFAAGLIYWAVAGRRA